MKLSALFASALVLASAGAASASTINLESYGSAPRSTVAAGANNSATYFVGSAPITSYSNGLPSTLGTGVPASSSNTYDLGTNNLSPWAPATGTSFWIAQNPGDYPGGSNQEANNTGYGFVSAFTDLDPLASSGTITVMADDTAVVYLNGNYIGGPASTDTAGTCASGLPTCTVPVTYNLVASDFVSGTNYLEFGVLQEHGSAEGLDFSGTVNVTPEPNSLLLLGSGLSTMAGYCFRRRRVQA